MVLALFISNAYVRFVLCSADLNTKDQRKSTELSSMKTFEGLTKAVILCIV